MAKVYLVEATHWNVSGVHRSAFATLDHAEAQATVETRALLIEHYRLFADKPAPTVTADNWRRIAAKLEAYHENECSIDLIELELGA